MAHFYKTGRRRSLQIINVVKWQAYELIWPLRCLVNLADKLSCKETVDKFYNYFLPVFLLQNQFVEETQLSLL